MQSKATTVKKYLAELPADRRTAIEAVRKVILQNLGEGFEEGIQYGMIGYYVPHRLYPDGYHCDPKQPLPFACLASQKNHMAVYMMSIYSDGDDALWFRKAWAATGRKLDMGKSCIRFKTLDDVALEVLGDAIRRMPVERFIAFYETALRSMNQRPSKKTSKVVKPAKKPKAAKPKAKQPKAVKPMAKRR